jgi:alpha-beta hydrolase superfamily lysophospholipase
MALFSVPLMTGCIATPTTTLETSVVRPPIAPATVFVANGAGNYQVTSRALRNLARKDGEPLEVITFDWSHGRHRFLADQIGQAHARAQGKKLADAVTAYHAKNPDRPIYLLGHSAGTAVVMVALENLPEPIVERAILLAPSLSAHYNVQLALHAVKQSLNVFYSPHDFFYLGVATGLVGTPDRRWTATAGRTGFNQPLEPEVQSKLIQRSWQPADRMLGNNGGHFGAYQPDYLRAHVIPLFDSAPRSIGMVP